MAKIVLKIVLCLLSGIISVVLYHFGGAFTALSFILGMLWVMLLHAVKES
jgi:hypothetical protein